MVRSFWLISALFAAALTLAITDRESGLPMWEHQQGTGQEAHQRKQQRRFEAKTQQTKGAAMGHDPAGRERAIREGVEWARPGETVIRFVERDNGPAARLN